MSMHCVMMVLCSYRLQDELEYQVKEGDSITFISTLHGG